MIISRAPWRISGFLRLGKSIVLLGIGEDGIHFAKQVFVGKHGAVDLGDRFTRGLHDGLRLHADGLSQWQSGWRVRGDLREIAMRRSQ